MSKTTRELGLRSILIAVLVSLLGFGVMNFFYFSSIFDFPKPDPGLYDYKAAVWGDGLFLPLFIAAMYFYVKTENLIKKKHKNISMIIGTVAAIIGGIWQLSWLLDENIKINWTIPKKYMFNAAGWYHSLMFIAFFFVIAMLLTQVFFTQTLNKKDTLSPRGMLSNFFIWLFGSGFIFLIVLDDHSNSENYINNLLLVVFPVFLVVAICFYLIPNFKKIKQLSINVIYNNIICILSGCLTSMGFAACLMGSINRNMFFSLIVILLSAIYVVPNFYNTKILLINILVIVSPTITLSLSLSNIPNNCIYMIVIMVSILLVVIGQYFQPMFGEQIIKSRFFLGFVSIVFIFLIMSFNFDFKDDNSVINQIISQVINQVICLFTSVISLFIIRNNFAMIKRLENDTYLSKFLKNIKKVTYPLIISIVIGCLVFLSITLSSFIEIEDMENVMVVSSEISLINYRNLFICGLIVVVSIILLIIIKRIPRTKRMKFIIPFGLISYVSLGCFFLILKSPIYTNLDITSIFYIFSLFMVFGSTFMFSLGFRSNILNIRGLADKSKPNKLVKAATILIFIGTLLNVLISILPSSNPNGNRSSGIEILLLSILQLIITFIPIPACIAWLSKLDKEAEYKILKNTPVSGIVQDGGLIALIVILGGVIPIYMLSFISTLNLISIVSFIALIYNVCWPFSFCLENNVEHQKKVYERTKKLYLENKGKEEAKISINKQLKGLYEHLRNQNILTIISTAAYCFVPIIVIFLKYLATHMYNQAKMNAEGETTDKKDKDISAFKKFKQDYIPDKSLSQLDEE